MSDVVLDDLIQNDRTKKKTQLKAKKDGKGAGPRRRVQVAAHNSKIIRGRETQPQKPFKRQRQVVEVVRERSPPRDDGRKLRIIGLHPNITSNDLFEMFNKLGALDVCKVDQDNFGRSLTTATVVYHSAQSAQEAKREFNNHKIMNSTISVEFAKPKALVPKTKKIFKRVVENDNSGFRGNFRGNRPHGGDRGGRPFRGNRRGNFRGGRN